MIQHIKQLFKFSPLLIGIFFVGWIFKISKSELYLEGQRNALTDLYMIIPIIGSIIGFRLAKHWGGLKSFMGKSFAFFSFALFAEGVGLLIYSLFFRINGEELAYPSIGDFVFTAGIISSSVGAWWLLRVIAPVKKQIINPKSHFLVVLLAMSVLFYFVWHGFLYEGIIDDRGGLSVVFNVLYPTSQLVYLSLCLLALLKVKSTAGGKLFLPMLSLLLSMLLLYVADYVFLKQSYEESWQAAGSSDLLYILAYTAISTSLVYIDAVRSSITSPRNS